MKRIVALLSSVAVLCTSFTVFNGTDVNAADGVAINAANFPDAIFRNYVQENFDTDSDSVLSSDELSSVSKINVSELGIESVEGVEYFTELVYFYCNKNNLTELDISNNVLLEVLYCNNNQITALDVSNCANLEYFLCYSNSISTLIMGKHDNLASIYCYKNQLSNIDVSNCPALTYFLCYNNNLTSLDVSNNPLLEDFRCSNNQLTGLNVSNLTNLKTFYCYTNQITSLDIRNCSALTDFSCDYNKLRTIDVSNNTLLENLRCSNNQLTSLDVSNLTNLRELYCSINQITSLDVSNCPILTDFSCHFNKLTTIDVSNNPFLQRFSCDNNQLTSLDISNNTALTAFYPFNNSYNIDEIITNFDLSLLPGDFDAAKASNWNGATYSNGMLTNIVGIYGRNKITYDYDLGNGRSETFTLTYSPKMLVADDTSPLIDYTSKFSYNDEVYSVDVSKYIKIYTDTEVDPLLDANVAGAGDETVSPFDLYWSAYNSGNPTTGFNGTYAFDTSRIDELFDDISEEYRLDLSHNENSDLFIGILYDENYHPIEYSSLCKIAQRGDATLDHTIDAKDAAAIAKYTANAIISPDATINSTDNELGVFAADTNGDGFIDAKDAANAAKFSSQKALYPNDAPDAQSYYEIWNNILN